MWFVWDINRLVFFVKMLCRKNQIFYKGKLLNSKRGGGCQSRGRDNKNDCIIRYNKIINNSEKMGLEEY